MTAALGKVKGIVDLQFKRQSGTPTIAIHLIPQALAATGLKVQDVLDTIEAAYAGTTVGQTFQGTRTVDVVALLPDEVRHQPTQSAEPDDHQPRSGRCRCPRLPTSRSRQTATRSNTTPASGWSSCHFNVEWGLAAERCQRGAADDLPVGGPAGRCRSSSSRAPLKLS